MSARVIYDELSGEEADAEWVDSDGHHWRFEGPFWRFHDGDGVWYVGTPDPCFAPYVEHRAAS